MIDSAGCYIDPAALGALLLSWRKAAMLSARQAAAGMQISGCYLQRVEQGRNHPAFEVVARACQFYGKSLNYTADMALNRDPRKAPKIALCGRGTLGRAHTRTEPHG